MRRDSKTSHDSGDERLLHELLPDDGSGQASREGLASIVMKASGRRVPASSLLRTWTLGSFHAKVAAGYLAYLLRSSFADAEKRERLRNEALLSAALELLGTMGYLRGAVMKVGQMLANLPSVVPDEFADLLSALHFDAPPMHYSMLREVFLDEFGCEPEDLFAAFDRNAFAAASLGQVHRARLHSGEEVAVKIQYPDIARTIRADLRSLRLLIQPMRLTSGWRNLTAILAEMERMLLMEIDYEQEARFGRRARDLFEADDQVVVPRVYESHSTKRVLTADYLPGCHLRDFLASNPGQRQRDEFTELVLRATMRLHYRAQWYFADPHPGNFLFMPDGRLGLIDFGCIRVLSDEEWRYDIEMEEAAIAGDARARDRLLAKGAGFDDPSEMSTEHLAAVGRAAAWHMAPFLMNGPYDFGDKELFRSGLDAGMEAVRKRYAVGTAASMWLSRYLVGSRAVAYRLGGRCDLARVRSQELAGRRRVKAEGPEGSGPQ